MKYKRYLIILLLIGIMGFLFHFSLKDDGPEINANQIIDFENASVTSKSIKTNNKTYHRQGLIGSIWIDKDRSREGNNSIAFMLDPKENRREIKILDIPNNTIKYIGFSVYFPEDYKVPTDWNLFAQWWQGAPASPPIAFEIDQNTDEFQMRIVTSFGPHKLKNATVQYSDIIEKDEWIDFVVEMRIDEQGSNGILNVWKNGECIVQYHGPLGYTDLKDKTNFRLGLYRSPHIESNVTVYFDEINIGDRFK